MKLFSAPTSLRSFRRLRLMLWKKASRHNSILFKGVFSIIVLVMLFFIRSNFHHVPDIFRYSRNKSDINGTTVLSYPFASNIIVSELNRFIFCPIPKAASSNWKYLIRKFEGFHDYQDLNKAHHQNTSGFRYLSDYSPLEVQRILTDQTFYKFVFVRNPFKRLASCYMDKFLNKNATYVHAEYRSFLAQLFSWHYAREVDIYHQPRPSFQSFVDELTKQEPASMNAHWIPQTLQCGFGMVPYDFVGRMEHLDSHATHVLKAIHKAKHSFPTQKEIGFLPSGATKSTISTLYDSDIVAKVRALYDMDFQNLGYNTCEGRTDLLYCITE